MDADQIRARAYELWHKDGCPEGGALDYWLRAEAELAADDTPNAAGEGARAADEPAAKPRASKARPTTPRSAGAKAPAKASLPDAAVAERADSLTKQQRTRKKAEG